MPPTDSDDGAGTTASERDPEQEQEPERERGGKREQEQEREREGGEKRGRDRRPDGTESEQRDEKGSGLGFSLPPVRLPPFFPADFRFRVPVFGGPRAAASPRRALLAALIFDAADAALALTTGPPIAYVRTVAGALIAGALVGPGGAVAVWEVAVVVLGQSALTLFPTLAALVVLRVVALR
jgi:hypothetical protein